MASIDIKKIAEINEIVSFDQKIYEAALYYVENGFRIIPLEPNSKKLPGKRHNINYSHATTKVEMVKKWFGPEGRFRGWNIGIATGCEKGVFALDIDTHGEVNGFASMEKIVPEGYEYDGPVQITPSGGNHLLFNWQENATSSTNKVGLGIDTRGGDWKTCRGHVVAWPSIVDNVQYQWNHGGETPDIPFWILDRLGKSWQGGPPPAENRGNEQMSESDMEDKFSEDTLENMLKHINPDELSYDDWIQIGMAIHTQIEGPSGLKIWDDWSKQGERYKQGECADRWSGFTSGGPVRIGTLIHYARLGGFRMNNPQRSEDQNEIDAIIDDLNGNHAVVPIGGDVMILEEIKVPKEMKNIQPPYRLLKRAAFKSLHENEPVIFVSNANKVIKTTRTDIWLSHPNRRTYPSGIGMFPGKPKGYHGYYNLWPGFAYEPVPGDWSKFDAHIRDIVCDENEELYNWVLDWMADAVQDPANPKGCAIILHGIEGCGKGTFAQMFGALFGAAFKHLTSVEHLTGRFSGHLADAVFVFADEVTYGGDRKVAGKLKAMVSERVITSERKGVDAIQQYNCAHMVIASNEDWFIPAGPQSRRWLILEVSGRMAGDDSYFEAIHDQMEKKGGFEAMLHDLMNRKITSRLNRAPVTEALKGQRSQYTQSSQTKGSIAAWLARAIDTESLGAPPMPRPKTPWADEIEEDPLWPNKVRPLDIYAAYEGWAEHKMRRPVATHIFFTTLKELGFVRKVIERGGKRMNCYEVPCKEDLAKVITEQHGIALKVFEDTLEEELEEGYEEEQSDEI